MWSLLCRSPRTPETPDISRRQVVKAVQTRCSPASVGVSQRDDALTQPSTILSVVVPGITCA